MNRESLREAYGKQLVELGRKDPRLMVFDADLSSSTQTGMFGKAFPDRFFNMGISEQSMVTAAAGAALTGRQVFVSTFAVFLTRTYEQLRQSVCYNNVNVKFVVTHAGITVGEDGATHQIVEDVGIMSGLPNMSVIVPVDSLETASMVRYMHEETTTPYYMRLSREKFPVLNDSSYEYIPKKSVTFRDGSDLTIMAYGATVAMAIEAAELLKKKGIDTRVINMSSIKPIDSDAIIRAARETGKIVTAEEHSIYNGLGSRVAEIVAENYPVPVTRIGMKDTFGKSGSSWELFEYFHMGPEDIAHTSEEAFREVSKYENIS